jgi:hypothetical protein
MKRREFITLLGGAPGLEVLRRRRIAKIHFVSAPIVSANDGVGHVYSRSSDAVPTFASACFRNGKPNGFGFPAGAAFSQNLNI